MSTTETPPLSDAAYTTLRVLGSHSRPRHEFNPGVVGKLVREGFASLEWGTQYVRHGRRERRQPQAVQMLCLTVAGWEALRARRTA